MKHLRTLAINLFALTLLTASGRAQVTLFGDPSGGSLLTPQTTWGARLTVGGQDLTVTSLGAYQPPGRSYAETHPVGIWDSGGGLLASATVTSSSPQVGDWRFETITPLTLTSGQTYRIGSFFFNDPAMIGGAASIASGVTADPQWLDITFTPALSRPNFDNAGNLWAANMQFIVPVPEPTTGCLVSGILLLTFALARHYTNWPSRNRGGAARGIRSN